jgi:hypothetical protein
MCVVVAVVGIGIGAERIWRRWVAFREQARFHAQMAWGYEATIRHIDEFRRGEWPHFLSIVFLDTLPDGTTIQVSARHMDRFVAGPPYHEEVSPADRVTLDRWTSECRRLAEYHARQRGKYERAARRPWSLDE